MSSPYEIPRLKKHVLIALADDTRVHGDIYLNIPRSDAPYYEPLADFLNQSKESFFPAHLDNEQFVLVNKDQVLYIQETKKCPKEITNTDFKSVMFFFGGSKIKANIYLNLLSHQQRLSDAFNQKDPFLHCYQYDCLTFINKNHIVKANQIDMG
jgi:hypothetical protein